MLIDGKSSQEYPVNAGVPQQSILCPTFFFICTDELPDDICNVAIYADDTTLYLKYDEVSDLWQILLLVSELKSDLQDTVGAGSCLSISMLGKFFYLGKFNVGKTLLLLM